MDNAQTLANAGAAPASGALENESRRSRLGRRHVDNVVVVLVVLLVVAVACLGFVGPASAHVSAGVPDHQLSTAWCNEGWVSDYPVYIWPSPLSNVYRFGGGLPALYRGNQWVYFSIRITWYGTDGRFYFRDSSWIAAKDGFTGGTSERWVQDAYGNWQQYFAGWGHSGNPSSTVASAGAGTYHVYGRIYWAAFDDVPAIDHYWEDLGTVTC